MFDDLLKTKLFLPTVRASDVVRPRLIDKLNQGATRKLCLISASPGFGKTTLIASWAGQSQRPAAWIALDSGDNEPTRFLAYLMAALQLLQPVPEGISSAPLQPHLPPLNETVLIHLVNEIARHSAPFSLVLDDYHLLTEPRIHEAVTFILDKMPPNMNLIIITRQDPPLPLTRLRAQGQMLEIRQTDLRFTADETVSFLNTYADLNLTQAEVLALEKRTEGWAVGLQLAALALQSATTSLHPVEMAHWLQSITSSNRFILDYLIEEVLSEQPLIILDFLLKTAILDRLSGSLCDAVLGIEVWRQGHEMPDYLNAALQPPITSQQMLEYLDRANLFIVPSDYSRQWYRYHSLFADLLRQRLEQQLDRESIAQLHGRASQWYEDHAMPYQAIDQAFAATDFSRAAHLIERYGQRALWEQGLYVTVTQWLNALPDEVIAAHPTLTILHALGLGLIGKIADAEKRLQMAEKVLDTLSSDQQSGLIGQIIVARLYIVSFVQLDQQSVEQIKLALAQIPREDTRSRGSIMALLGNAYRLQGNLNLASQTLAEAVARCRQAGNMVAAVMALNMLNIVERSRGRLRQALVYCRQAQEISTQTLPNEPTLMGITLLALGEIQYQRNELDEALASLTRGIQLALQSDTLISQHAQTGYLSVARVQQAQGSYEMATQTLIAAQSSDTPAPIKALLATYQARLDLSLGNLARAEQWADAVTLTPERFATHSFDTELSTLIRVRIAQGQLEIALDLLTQAQVTALTDERWGDLLEITILQALAYQVQGNLSAALKAVTEILSQAKAEGYVRLFVDEGLAMATLLRQAAKVGIVPDYVAQLLAAFPHHALSPENSVEHQPLPDPLSERELDVLRRMVVGYSNPEIAHELVVSVGTIKTHTSHIYVKLNVRNRAEAIKRAIELKLV
jgi:LuxR family maltose regulon positive regulatory protein